MKRSPLARKTPLRPRRATPRNRKSVVRLTGEDMNELRWRCWERDLCICQDCGLLTLLFARFDGDPEAYDMAHVQSRGAGGSDTLDNVVTKCHRCHMREHAGLKSEGRL